MTITEISFPVLCLYRKTPAIFASSDALTSTTTAALNAGFFTGLRVIDAEGVEAVVRCAKKVRGIGPFFGFNVFLNRRVRVELELEATGKTLSPNDVRKIVLRDFRNWHGWESRDDFERLKASVEKSETVREILRRIS